MKLIKFLFVVFLLLQIPKVLLASGEHDDHDHAEETDEHEGDPAEEEGHDEDEEGRSAVGPEKGIIEKNDNGFKLSVEAVKAFALESIDFKSLTSELSREALVEIKDQKFIYRLRNDFIKRIPVKIKGKNKNNVIVEMSNIKAGDKILVAGTGFVRVAELVVEEGVAHGHSH